MTKKEWNEQSFSPDEVKQGLQNDLLNYLLNFNTKSKESYFDIHIWTDGYTSVVEWSEKHFNDVDIYEEGTFKYVPYYGEIMLPYQLPDDTYKMFNYEHYEKETKLFLKEWLEKNPGWEKNCFGIWTKINETKKEEE